MKHYICLAFLLICLSINAQNDITAKASLVDSIFSPKLTGEAYVQESDISGDLYFNYDWLKSNILLSTGGMVYGEKLKYNGYSDEVIWLNTSNLEQYQLDKSYISDFWMEDNLNTPIHFKQINMSDSTSGNLPNFFVQVAVEGKMSLFIQRKISHLVDQMIRREDGQSLYVKVLEPTPLYYIKLPSNQYLKMSKINRRHFLNLFPEQKKSISKLIKQNHLNLKSESGLIKAIDLMNKSVLD